MKSNILILGCALALNCSPLSASEVDSFSHRYELKEDASPILNTFTNARIDRALGEANQYIGCNETVLRKKLKKYLSGDVIAGPVEAYVNANLDGDIPAIRYPRSQSIYREVKFLEAPVLVIFKSAVGAIVQIDTPEGKVVVGADKFGHFFTEGLVYYKRAFEKKRGVQKVLDWGVRTEKGKFGLLTTATYSNADLVANYNGMTFWANLIEKKFQAPGPYFACDRGEWKKLKEFDWRNYVDAGFDEGINCNRYTERVGKKVKKALAQLEAQSGQSFTCPVASGRLALLKTKYGDSAPYLLYSK
ncbi:MAG: hypothetical protein A2X86_10025 [Bdellovibrionales bacterium GWA2_49_15]|nr:MAG: hypothetical protein A2X86_10025 [Bdellovibrionales bacterium GWA2_49_15]HAZ13121.1 hypothetical protein [Bdellovibrionales bacterium]